VSGGPRTVILVSGDGSNLQAILDQVRSGGLAINIVGVLSDRPGVRALERARAAGVLAETIDFAAAGSRAAFSAQLSTTLAGLRPDLVILAGFMRILDDGLVEQYRGRMLNVHPSLLPKYPGLHTYRRALAAGDPVQGATVHFVVPELDAGPGIVQYRVPVRARDTEGSLRDRVRRGEHLIYPRAIAWLAAGRAALRDGAVWLDGERLTDPVVVDEVAEERSTAA
jgi:phosphoribosylglycinamide formyltransferase-1